MAYFIAALLVIIVVGTVLNWRSASRAEAGYVFEHPAPPSLVSKLVEDAYSPAKVRSLFRGVNVEQRVSSGQDEFSHAWRTNLGDRGYIKITPSGSGSRIEARATDLHVGHKREPGRNASTHQYLTGAALIILRHRPNSRKICRFNSGVEKNIERSVAKAMKR